MMLLLCSNDYIWHLYCIPKMEHFTMQSPDFHSLKHSQFTYAINVVDLGMESVVYQARPISLAHCKLCREKRERV